MKMSYPLYRLSLLLALLTSAAVLSLAGCTKVQFSQAPCSPGDPCVTQLSNGNVTETLTFTSSNKVDILIVDDNSGSMQYEQTNMANYFGTAISTLNGKNFDYRVGVTTTDICPSTDASSKYCASTDTGARGQFVGQGSASFGLQNILSWSPTNENANIGSQFSATIQRPETLLSNVNQVASGDERAIYAMGLSVQTQPTFFRSDANLAVIILSDEDERSVGGCEGNSYYNGCTSDPGYQALADADEPQAFVDTVNSAFGGDKTTMVNSIIAVPGDSACLAVQQSQAPDYTGHYGYHYQAMSNLQDAFGNSLADVSGTTPAGNPLWMTGQVQSICASNFSTTMNNITAAISNMPVSNTMTLKFVPNAIPTVTFNPSTGATNWNWSAGTDQIVFTTRPPVGTTVTATYSYDQSQNNQKTPKRFNVSSMVRGGLDHSMNTTVNNEPTTNGASDSN